MQVYGIIRLISQHQIEGGEAFELFYYVSNATYMVNEKKDDRREDFFEIYPYGLTGMYYISYNSTNFTTWLMRFEVQWDSLTPKTAWNRGLARNACS
jgi:hypothetical protein